jgi:hypothetical protein
MITLFAAGVGLVVLVAIVVGIIEATQAPTWRQIATERHAQWEARQPQLHDLNPYAGPHSYHDSWDDSSWDDGYSRDDDAFAQLRTHFAESPVHQSEADTPEIYATGVNGATDDVNEVLNLMGPPPAWTGTTPVPTNPTPAGIS